MFMNKKHFRGAIDAALSRSRRNNLTAHYSRREPLPTPPLAALCR
jgi:hypothetical protein